MLLNKKIPIAYIFNKIKTDIASVFIVALIVLFLTKTYQALLPEMPFTIPTFLGTAISILLSFKLSQSYDRWWEARKIWGCIVNDSRSFVIELQMLTDMDTDTVKKLAYRQIAWCYALGNSLRGLDPLKNLKLYLSEKDLEEIKAHANKPLALLQLNAMDIKQCKEKRQLNTFSLLKIDETLVRLCDSQGKAERIKTTIFPVTYRMFLHFIIYLFLVILSIALKEIDWYFQIPLLLLISSAFFLLEKSATIMQDPFENKPTDTAMTAIAKTIEINIKQLLKETNVPAPQQSENFYLL
jgi:putative membrane protein